MKSCREPLLKGILMGKNQQHITSVRYVNGVKVTEYEYLGDEDRGELEIPLGQYIPILDTGYYCGGYVTKRQYPQN